MEKVESPKPGPRSTTKTPTPRPGEVWEATKGSKRQRQVSQVYFEKGYKPMVRYVNKLSDDSRPISTTWLSFIGWISATKAVRQ